MILSNQDIEAELESGDLVVDPMSDSQIQPASIDLTLGDDFVVYGKSRYVGAIEPWDEDSYRRLGTEYSGKDSIYVKPDQFVIATTQERVSLPDDIVGTVEGVSSMGRLGPIPHTAGHIDPGFEGQITLEIKNLNPHPVILKPGMRFCQIVLKRTESPASPSYGEKPGAKYQDQAGATTSQYHEEVDEE